MRRRSGMLHERPGTGLQALRDMRGFCVDQSGLVEDIVCERKRSRALEGCAFTHEDDRLIP